MGILVVPSRKALVVASKEPNQILSCIPTAKPFTYKGNTLIYVPHEHDETQVLRNIGHRPPSPIGFYYDYPLMKGRYEPFKHQRRTSEFLTLYSRCVVLNQPRTGKTMSCLWSFDYLRKLMKVRKVLIVAPLSTLDIVWGEAIFETFWWYKFEVLYGTREKRLSLLKKDADIFIVNHHGFEIIKDDLPSDIDLIIYDEANVLRNPQTNLFKSFHGHVSKKPALRLWLLTGTPTPNAPTDAWALAKLIGAPVPRWTAFRDMTMYKVTNWQWRERPNAMETVSKYLQPSILFRRDDCFDLPPLVYESRKCEVTPEQKKALTDMLRALRTDIEGAQVTAVNEAAKVQKILQILLGTVYMDNGETAVIVSNERIKVIKELIEECSEKVIVFVPFTGALDNIAEALKKDYTVEVVNGRVSKSRRNAIFRAFQNDKDPRVLVADARTMSHGLDLTAATTVIWAGPTNSNDTYDQANVRVVGPNQKHKASIVRIEATPVERKVYYRLEHRQSMQGILLDLIQTLGEQYGI